MRVAIVADRIGWEERQFMEAADGRGWKSFWVNDGDLCVGARGSGIPPADVHLMRSRSYTRCLAISGLLADRGDRVVNTAEAISVCQDKLLTSRALHNVGIPVPEFRVVLTRHDLARAIEELGLPCVIKPIVGGLGRRVFLIRDPDLAASAYDYVEQFAQGFDRVLLAQRYLPGADERAFVVGHTVVAAYRRRPAGDWRANLSTGGVAEAIEADDEIIRLATATTATIGAGIYALDLLTDAEGVRHVNEVNHVAMFRGAFDATGVDVAGAVMDHLAAGAESAVTTAGAR
ncbi:ATP-grasp domain-containing protein [Micromonospora chersina]|uniref:ATP-grasp domain-containing protein n=1 Tax=Micromonospora chersina TaxID=47854 RepID=UPI003712C90A